MSYVNPPVQLELPDSLRVATGMGFEVMLCKILAMREPVEKIDEHEALPDNLPPLFAPEIATLRYEILRAKGLKDRADQIRKSTLEKYPGLAFRFEDADGNQGITMKGRKVIEEENRGSGLGRPK